MTDTFGATSLPVASVARDVNGFPTEQVGDPMLTTLLAFVSAIWTAECATAWANLAPNETLIRCANPHDPREEDFGTSRLPALFAYREPGKPARFADGEMGEERAITLLWVYPPCSSDKQTARRGVGVAMGRALHKALEYSNGRHTSWKVTGDTDPDAATYGSSILTWGGFTWLRAGEARATEITVGEARYDAVSFALTCREDYTPGAQDGLGAAIQAVIDQGPDGFEQTINETREFTPEFSLEFD